MSKEAQTQSPQLDKNPEKKADTLNNESAKSNIEETLEEETLEEETLEEETLEEETSEKVKRPPSKKSLFGKYRKRFKDTSAGRKSKSKS